MQHNPEYISDARRETLTTLVGESCPNCGARIQRRDLYKHFAACPRGKRQHTGDSCNFGSTLRCSRFATGQVTKL